MYGPAQLLLLLALVSVLLSGGVDAASKTVTPTNTKPTTLNNAQSGCVQYGDCTKQNHGSKTEKYSSAVKPPHSTSIPYLSGKKETTSYIASVASQGAANAYNPKKASNSKTPVPPETTVASVVTLPHNKGTTTEINTQNSGAVAGISPSISSTLLALVGTVSMVAFGGVLIL